ncbi:MAG TPA: M3 family metallopeptidase, partial [Pseudomonadaceae bacterium]|nr:M3 family metallopeptidase [Pseudomonadaceae bacterium]
MTKPSLFKTSLVKTSLYLSIAAGSLLVACSEPAVQQDPASAEPASPVALENNDDRMNTTDNPFLSVSSLDLQYPRFDLIRDEHYLPAFERGMAEQLAEIEEITSQTAAPTFANTLVPLELSGQLLNRVSSVFFSLGSAHTNDAIQALEVELTPRLTAHRDSVLMNAALFARVQAVHAARDSLGLDPESLRLVEENYKDFVRAGAMLDEASKESLKAINSEMASLETRFDQNVLAERNDSAVVVTDREQLAGLSDAEIQSLADEAEARGLSGQYVLPLLNTSGQPLLPSLDNRELRERVYRASLARGTRGNEFDNREILARTARLRAEKANLLGYPNHAAYVLERQTAQTVAAVNQRLSDLTPRAIANARREAQELQAMIDSEGAGIELAAWDWAYYAEKVRQEQYSFDETLLKPYFEFNNVLQKGVFHAATQIFGLRFEERPDLPVYQEDVRVFEVLEEDGSTLALFIMDP